MGYRFIHISEDGSKWNYGGNCTKESATKQIKQFSECLKNKEDWTLKVSKLEVVHNENGSKYCYVKNDEKAINSDADFLSHYPAGVNDSKYTEPYTD